MRTPTPVTVSSFAAAVLAVAVTGCGGNSGGDIPIDKTADDFAAAICPKAYDCCTAEQLMKNEAAGMTEPQCEVATAQNFRNVLQGAQASQNAKRSRYDQPKVDACLQTIRASTCETLRMTNHLSGIPGCDVFATPLLALGGECSSDYECIDGWCRLPKDPEPAGPGTCTAKVAVGQSCAADARCALGLACDAADAANAGDDVCVQPGDNGASCANGSQCKSGVCASSGTPGALTCTANTAALCFYSSGCSLAGGGGPTLAAFLLMVALLAVARGRAGRGHAAGRPARRRR